MFGAPLVGAPVKAILNHYVDDTPYGGSHCSSCAGMGRIEPSASQNKDCSQGEAGQADHDSRKYLHQLPLRGPICNDPERVPGAGTTAPGYKAVADLGGCRE